MFERLGRAIVQRRTRVLVIFLITFISAGAIGSLAFGRLDSGGYTNPNSESAKAYKYLQENFNIEDPSVVLVVDSGSRSVDDKTVVSDVLSLTAEIKQIKNVSKTFSYWDMKAPQLKSSDGKAAYIFIYATKSDFDSLGEVAEVVTKTFGDKYRSLTLYATGTGAAGNAINGQISKDLYKSESIAIPLTFLLLLFIFGGLVASATPLVVGVSAILGSFFVIYLISLLTDVSIFAINLITGLGLGLGIDYSLLIVNRFREELHRGLSVNDAVIKTVATAGRTVFFSGLTIMVTLGSMLVFPLYFLKSFGYAGITVVAMAVIGALIPLPAMLALLGHRIDKYTVRKSALTPKEDGGWAKTAHFVMRRPVAVLLLTLVGLSVFAAPIKDIAFGQVDSQVLPKDHPAAVAARVADERFPGRESVPVEFVIENGAKFLGSAELTKYQEAISATDGILYLTDAVTSDELLRFNAIHSMSPRSLPAEALIDKLREIPAPDGTLIGGAAADYTDTQQGIADALPWALLWISVSVLLLLFVFTGSILLPIKAVLLNILSLAASLGVVTWIFIDGNLANLLGGFTVTGTLDTGSVILIAVTTFGLSMDYEVFLLSRIKEEYEAGKSNSDAVAIGLQKSARIITAAAFVLAVVFGAFILGGVTSIKMLGFGVAFAILIDATIVRGLLVPALMRLFGAANWWAPKQLKRFTISH